MEKQRWNSGIQVYNEKFKGMEAAVLGMAVHYRNYGYLTRGNKVNVVLGYQCLEECGKLSNFLGACVRKGSGLGLILKLR